MTLYCPRCGEPWTLDSLHTEVERRSTEQRRGYGEPAKNGYERVFNQVREDFYKRGCEALGATHNPEGRPTPAAVAVYYAYGDDVDAAAGDMEWARRWLA